MSEKITQVVRRRRQRAHGDALRSWIQDRQIEFDEKRKERRQARDEAKKAKLLKQVQEGLAVNVKYLVRHTDENYRTRRDRGQFHGSGMRSGSNQPYVNPGRDLKRATAKKGRRLRAELRSR